MPPSPTGTTPGAPGWPAGSRLGENADKLPHGVVAGPAVAAVGGHKDVLHSLRGIDQGRVRDRLPEAACVAVYRPGRGSPVTAAHGVENASHIPHEHVPGLEPGFGVVDRGREFVRPQVNGPGTRLVLGRASVKNPEELVEIAAVVANVERIADVIVKWR